MRHLIFACSLLLVAQAMPGQQSVSHIDEQLATIAKQHHGDIALYAENLTTHQIVALSPDTPVQTASVIKLAVLFEALEQVRAGKAHFSDRLTLTTANQVEGSGLLQFFDTPLSLSFKDILTMMVVMSDNTGTNVAIDHVGLENVDARMGKIGLTGTWMYKKVYVPVAPGTVMPADQKRFGLGKTTAREMATLMSRIARCELGETGVPPLPGDTAICQVAWKMLQSQNYRTAIPRYLDGLPGATGDSIANKTGSLDAVRNDVAAISTPTGMVIISAFTFNNKDHSWIEDQEAELTIAKMARAIVQEWSPQGLAPWPGAAKASAVK